ncbi:hypothetical protein BJ508DRAFT_333069 [Ascobolus immersus RN42]|uniref:Uncharacterized protein n=1 Tax=Ascobolus immersus RN42 TaxID=1160509 RepID=A0A3N4HKQ0_ASCIM|nr:hypothetical protein BJ508DRAFT_333069 [Ascobolus immersus RN42]
MDRYVIHGITESQFIQQQQAGLEEWREQKEEDIRTRHAIGRLPSSIQELQKAKKREAVRKRVQHHRAKLKEQKRKQEEADLQDAPVIPWTKPASLATEGLEEGHAGLGEVRVGDADHG